MRGRNFNQSEKIKIGRFHYSWGRNEYDFPAKNKERRASTRARKWAMRARIAGGRTIKFLKIFVIKEKSRTRGYSSLGLMCGKREGFHHYCQTLRMVRDNFGNGSRLNLETIVD